MFVEEGEEEIRQVTAQLSLLTERIIQKHKKQRNIRNRGTFSPNMYSTDLFHRLYKARFFLF